MTYQCKQADIGDKCIECFRSTSFGSYRVHYECLTEEEKQIMEKNNA